MGFVDGFKRGLARGRHQKIDDGPPDPWLEQDEPYREQPSPEFETPHGGEDEAAVLVEELQQRIDSLEAELETRDAVLAEKQELLLELAALVEPLQARIAELESVSDAAQPFIEVLLLPGVKDLLRDTFHPDRHAGVDEAARRMITGWSQTVNAAYELIKRRKTDQPVD
jgi:hypothetical protein